MKFITTAIFLFVSMTIVSSQYFGADFDSTGSYNGLAGLSSLTGDFGGSSAFASTRDARQNRGPVTFPEPPKDAPVESSGVIVGASGYGFVPPQNQFQTSFPFSFARNNINEGFSSLSYF